MKKLFIRDITISGRNTTDAMLGKSGGGGGIGVSMDIDTAGREQGGGVIIERWGEEIRARKENGRETV